MIFFEPKRIYRQYKEEVADDGEALPLDVCFVLRDGSDVTLVTWGARSRKRPGSGRRAGGGGHQRRGRSTSRRSSRWTRTIVESVAKTGRCVIVHEAPKTAGFGAEIAARLAEESMFDLVAPVERVTG